MIGGWVAMAIVQSVSGKWLSDLEKSREFNTKMAAMNFEKSIEFRQALSISNDNRRLSELLDVWHKLHGKALKDGLRRYKLLYRVCESLGDPIAANLTAEAFAIYREKRSYDVSTGTMNREHSYLRAVYNELLRLGVIKYANPLVNIRQFKEKENPLRFLTGDEINELLSCCINSSNKSLIYVVKTCLSTGARWGEAENLTASQVVNNQVTYLDTKNGRKSRTVPISDDLFNDLLKLDKSGDERLFIGCIGAFRRAIAESNIDLPKGQLTHVLRHTFASHFVMNGGNIIVLKDILGHSTITTTMRYAHLAPDFLSDAITLNPLVKPAA